MFFVFCFLFTDAIKIQVTEKTNIFAQEESSIEKTLPAKVESLLMKHFDLNQTQKKVFTKICSIQNFSTMRWRYICIKAFERDFEDLKETIIFKFAGDRGELQKNISSDNRGQY